MATVKQLYDLLDRKAPFRTQMDFDNAGFLVGRGDRTVTRVMVALDITPNPVSSSRYGQNFRGTPASPAMMTP